MKHSTLNSIVTLSHCHTVTLSHCHLLARANMLMLIFNYLASVPLIFMSFNIKVLLWESIKRYFSIFTLILMLNIFLKPLETIQ